jgi:iron complex outermembrane receptor protein
MGNNSFTKRIFFVFLVTLINLSVFAQQRKVTGTINATTGQALVGVSVAIKGTSKGTTTDANGKFGIEVDNNQTLVFSFVGYQSQSVQVGNRQTIDITLTEATENLDEVVVTGYSTNGQG